LAQKFDAVLVVVGKFFGDLRFAEFRQDVL
jgi:hypothetical protein